MSKKIRVGILFGGKSAEHEISLLSAKSVVNAIDKNKYEVVLIGINKAGEWFFHEDLDRCLTHPDNAKLIHLNVVQENVALVPKENGNPLVNLDGTNLSRPLDVVFPVLHGTYGEDGTVQGLLKLANIPFVGASVLSSAIGMDKDVMKRLLRDAGIPIAKFMTVMKHEFSDIQPSAVKQLLGMPLFVKPANMGSSIGISKVHSETELKEKLALAFKYDKKVLIEEYIPGREIECSVLGNEYPQASLPGEFIPQHEFYSYEAKYLDENGALFEIPARLNDLEIKRIQELSIETYKVLGCEGMARVDMFLTKEGKILVNEINTIPGFTSISMYPKLWEISGISYPELIDHLIKLAMARFNDEQNLLTNVIEPQHVASDRALPTSSC